MSIENRFENGIITFCPVGKIDSVNSPEIEKEIMDACEGKDILKIVLDLERLIYISSSGLRIILRLKKAYKDVVAINASSEVYEILDITGFTEMIDVQKAYRKISIEGCEIIGRGANGIVYRIDGDTIVKVYYGDDSLAAIKREKDLARKAFVKGIPTAIPYDIVKVDDHYGTVFEMLNAKSLLKIIKSEPERMDEVIKSSVNVLKRVHETTFEPGEITSMKEETLLWRKDVVGHLPDYIVSRFFELVEKIPDSLNTLHCDYYIKNIMQQGDEILLIDMDTLSHGNIVFEFAFIYNAYVGYGEYNPKNIEDFLGLSLDITHRIWDKTLDYYFTDLDAQQKEDIVNKFRVIGYMRHLRRMINHKLIDSEDKQKEFDWFVERLRMTLGKVTDLTV